MNTDDPEFDPACDPQNPKRIKYEDVIAAAKRIAGTVIRTPCTKAHMSAKLGLELYLKQDFLQFTGCFKERGVRNILFAMSEEQRKAGVVSATMGNHGLAMAYHSGLMRVPCIIVMPTHIVMDKVIRIEEFGAKCVLYGSNMADAIRHGIALSKEKKMLYVNGFDHPNICEGQGTIALEVLEQVPDLDAILCPCGGGSLLTGVCVAMKHLKPDVEVYGVETNKTCSMTESLKKNERIYFNIDSTICDGLAINVVGVNTFHTLKGLVDKMVVVREDWVARGIMHIIEEERYVVCGAGGTTVSAVLAGLFPNLKGKKVVAVCSGGAIGTPILARALERGMSAEGRLIKFRVTVSDRPQGVADLCSLLASDGVILRDVVPETSWCKGDVFSVEMKIIAETRGWDHVKDIVDTVKKHYTTYSFPEMGEQSNKRPASSRRGPCLAPHPVCHN